MYFQLSHSDQKDKKFKVIIFDENKKKIKTLHFGAEGYSDFTQHKDEKRKQRYLQRHKKNEDWNNILTAGFWSRYLLWEKPTIQQSIKFIEDNFNLKQIN